MVKIDFKSLIIGAAISAAIVIFASYGYDWLYPFSAVGLIYVGYKAENMVMGAVLGAVASIPLCILALQGAFGEVSAQPYSQAIMVVAVLLVGVIIGFVGAYAQKNRQKAIKDYEKKQKIGKNKKKK